uniref:Ovule protein n=1 Tax=Mesocestoides corti TaxID=53468 RepID=A0A5K3ESG8_MESCO
MNSCMTITYKTGQALLNNHDLEPHLMHRLSKYRTLAFPILIYSSSFVSFPGWLHSLVGCHWIAESQGIGWGLGGPICLRPDPSPHHSHHCRIPEP